MRWATSAFTHWRRCSSEGHDVVAFDLESRRARKLASGFDERVRSSGATSPSGIAADALDGVDAVIHLAAIIPPPRSERPTSLAG